MYCIDECFQFLFQKSNKLQKGNENRIRSWKLPVELNKKDPKPTLQTIYTHINCLWRCSFALSPFVACLHFNTNWTMNKYMDRKISSTLASTRTACCCYISLSLLSLPLAWQFVSYVKYFKWIIAFVWRRGFDGYKGYRPETRNKFALEMNEKARRKKKLYINFITRLT